MLQTCLHDNMEVNGGNDNKIWHLGKQALRCQFGCISQSVQVTAPALQVYQMFTGDGGEKNDFGDDNSEAGAGNGVVKQMIIPV